MKAMLLVTVSLAILVAIIPPASHAQWIMTNGPEGGPVRCLLANGTNLFAGDSGGVYLSTNDGVTWTSLFDSMTTSHAFSYGVNAMSLAVSGTYLFVAASNNGVFRSTNNGTTWAECDSGISTFYVECLAIGGSNLFAGTEAEGVFLSTNNGASWTQAGLKSASDGIASLAVSGTNLYAGATPLGMSRYGGGVHLSTNNGITWTFVGLAFPSNFIYCLAVSGTNIFAGTNWGAYVSADSGTSWTQVHNGMPNIGFHPVNSFAVSGTNIFAGTWNDGVFLSTNNGTSWTAVNSGLTTSDILSLDASETNLFAGTALGVFRRPLSEMITGVDVTSTGIPKAFTLEQNYPNPFNPSTNIRYVLPSKAHVTLSVFNTLGQQVATFVNEYQEAGYHNVAIDGALLSSGVYFYRIHAGEYTATKKMLLLK